jgi:hypothetical protein
MNFKKNILDDGNSNSPFRGLGGRFRGIFLLLIFTYNSFAQTPQTISFPDIAVKGYGDATFTLNATASSGFAVRYVSSDVTVASVSGSTVTIKKTGAFTVISAYQDGNTTYAAATPVPQLLVVCPKATLTVTAADKTIDSGTATPAFTYNIAGYKNSETSSVVSGIPTFQSLASFLSTGTYPIVINKGTLAATNYDFQLVDGKITVNTGTATPVLIDRDSLVKIYPIPASNTLHIDFQNSFDISILDIQGTEIIQIKDVKNSVSLAITHLKAGFYFVKIYSDSMESVYKVLISR